MVWGEIVYTDLRNLRFSLMTKMKNFAIFSNKTEYIRYNAIVAEKGWRLNIPPAFMMPTQYLIITCKFTPRSPDREPDWAQCEHCPQDWMCFSSIEGINLLNTYNVWAVYVFV